MQTYRKFNKILKEKKVGVAGLQPTLYLHDYSKFQTKNFSAFCTDNQSTNTKLRNFT